MGDGLKVLLVFVLVVVIFFGLIFSFGWFGVGYKNTVGIADANADRNIFEHNKAHVEGMAKDLAKYKYDFDTEKDVTNRKTIIQLIQHQYADFDANQIENSDLKVFYKML